MASIICRLRKNNPFNRKHSPFHKICRKPSQQKKEKSMAMKNNHWNFSLNTLSSKWPQFTFPLYHSIISSFNQFLCFNFLFPFFPFLVCFNYLPIFINSFNYLLADLMLVLLCFSTLNVCNSICLERCLFLTSGYREFPFPFLSLLAED